MRVLTVPNWSFGRDRGLLRAFRDSLESRAVSVHFLESDVDHNRTVSAFSGEHGDVGDALLELCGLAFERIDLRRHVGAHPRIGALDVCPFVPLGPPGGLDDWVLSIGSKIAEKHALPVLLYEKSERGRHESLLPELRRGGFGKLIGRELDSDFGPWFAHERLGAAVIGLRDWLIAMNVNLRSEDPSVARRIASQARRLRQEGDERFLGVRALGLPLASRGASQVSVNLTLPDLTPADPIIEWIERGAVRDGVQVSGCELIGVIRRSDLEGASRLPVRPEQVIESYGG